MDTSPAPFSRALRVAALSLALGAGCSDGGGDGFIDGLVASEADPTGVYDATYSVLTSNGCSLSPGDTGSIVVVITPSQGETFRIHIRLDGAIDIGPFTGSISAVSIGEVELAVTGVGALNEGTSNEILYDLDGTTLIAGGGLISGTLAEVASGAANCTVTRSLEGTTGSGSNDLPDFFWAFEVATIEAGSGCPSALLEPAEELTGVFTDLGSDSFLLSLEDDLGDVDELDVISSGDELIVSGSYVEHDGAQQWTVTIDASAVTVFEDFITGSLNVTLTGDIECEQVLGIYALRTSTPALVGDGLFEGSWLSADDGRLRPVNLRLNALPLGDRRTFAAVLADGERRLLLSGRLRTPWEVVGSVTLCRVGEERVDAGPLHMWRVAR